MLEGLFIIAVIALIPTVLVSVICFVYLEDYTIAKIIGTILIGIIIIVTIICCVQFGKSYNEEPCETVATVIKTEAIATGNGNAAKYIVWANDESGFTYEVSVTSIFYANAREGDSVIVYYNKVTHWGIDEKIEVTNIILNN